MKKAKLIILWCALGAIVLGLLIMFAALALGGFNWSSLSTQRTESVTHTPQGKVTDIEIISADADIQLLPSPDGKISVVADESEKQFYSVSITDGLLKIEHQNRYSWYDYIGIFIGKKSLTVYLPTGDYGKLGISTQSGSVNYFSDGYSFESAVIRSQSGTVAFNSAVAEALEISTQSGGIFMNSAPSTDALIIALDTVSGRISVSGLDGERTSLNACTVSGDITLNNCRGISTVRCDTKSGSLKLDGVTALSIVLVSQSGEQKLDGCDADSLKLTSASGDIDASLLSGKMFQAATNSGSVKIPSSTPDSGICECKTNSGDIDIEIE